MNLEMIWLIVPICAFLSQLGGSDYAPKALRRICIGIVIIAAVWYFKGLSWQVFMTALTQFGAFTLPFTLIGDGIPDHWFNWIWIWIWGILICVSALWLNLAVYPAILVCGISLGIMALLSNIPKTAKWFQWKMIEFFVGSFPAICVCLALTI